MVLGWAKNNEENCDDWMQELEKQKIRDIEAASGPAWKDFSFSPMLRTKLELWYENADEVRRKAALVIPNFHGFESVKKAKYKVDIQSRPASSEFSENRFSEQIPYIGKTKYFLDLFKKRSVFLSRPSRFGKTLLVNTLKSLFLGHQDIFKGLEIESQWDWSENKYPVIKLDFSNWMRDNFADFLVEQLIQVGNEYLVSFLNVERKPYNVFIHLVNQLRSLNFSEDRASTFVLLIDEYDKPVIDCLDNLKLVEENLGILISFLQMMKSASPIFSLVTGSSRLALSGIFDNRVDISFFPEFNALCGFTEYEIKQSLTSVLGNLNFDDLKDWYNEWIFF
jgi:hypothetical protein